MLCSAALGLVSMPSIYAYISVCMYACMYVCMYVCIYMMYYAFIFMISGLKDIMTYISLSFET